MFSIDVSALDSGTHTFNFKAKDLLDQWGDVFVDSFEISALLGDVNSDGTVDIVDVTLLVNHLLGGEAPVGFNAAAADIDGIEGVDANDLNALINIVLKK